MEAVERPHRTGCITPPTPQRLAQEFQRARQDLQKEWVRTRLPKGLELAARSRDWQFFGHIQPLMQAEAHQIDGALAALLSAPPKGV